MTLSKCDFAVSCEQDTIVWTWTATLIQTVYIRSDSWLLTRQRDWRTVLMNDSLGIMCPLVGAWCHLFWTVTSIKSSGPPQHMCVFVCVCVCNLSRAQGETPRFCYFTAHHGMVEFLIEMRSSECYFCTIQICHFVTKIQISGQTEVQRERCCTPSRCNSHSTLLPRCALFLQPEHCVVNHCGAAPLYPVVDGYVLSRTLQIADICNWEYLWVRGLWQQYLYGSRHTRMFWKDLTVLFCIIKGLAVAVVYACGTPYRSMPPGLDHAPVTPAFWRIKCLAVVLFILLIWKT